MTCLACERIAEIAIGRNRHFIAELDTGYVVLGDFQFFRGYTLLLCKDHVAELHDLRPAVKERFLVEMSHVAEAVYCCFSPRKLNYECLGNGVPHLHWHIFPRYEDDPSPGTTSWKIDKAIRYHERYRPSETELEGMKVKILDALRENPGVSIHSVWKDMKERVN